MAALALVGITGMYLHQVKQDGRAGPDRLRAVRRRLPRHRAASPSSPPTSCRPSPTPAPATSTTPSPSASGRHPPGDIGALQTVILVGGFLYLAGGLLFGIALYRARVLPRWAAALLAVGGLATAALSLMPDPWFRLLAFPNGIAMIALGYSLWRIAGAQTHRDHRQTDATAVDDTSRGHRDRDAPGRCRDPAGRHGGPE